MREFANPSGGGKTRAKLLAGAAAAVALTLGAWAGDDVHDDVLVWLRGDTDLNGDGIVQTNEVVDALSPTWSEDVRTFGWHDGTLKKDTAGDFVWTNDAVTVPYTKRTIPGALNYCFRQSIDADGRIMPNTIVMSNLASRITSNNWSFHVRFKWAGDPISTKTGNQCLLNAAALGDSDTSDVGHGFKLYVAKNGRLCCAIGQTYFLSDGSSSPVQISSNRWTDAVFVFNDGGKVDLSVMQEEGESGNALVTRSLSPSDKMYRPLPTKAFVLGNPTTRTAWANAATGANSYNAFRGQVSQFAVWNRSLSSNDVLRVLAWPGEDLVRAGRADGSAAEFDGEGEVSGAALDADAGWVAFGGDIAADASKSVAFTVPERYANLPQLLRWRGAADSASGRLELKAGETSLGVLDAGPNQWTVFYIPGEHFLSNAVTTLTLTRADAGTDPLRTDALAVGGSWQEGTISGNQWENNSGKEFYVPDGDFSHFPNAVTQGKSVRLLFDVPASVAGSHKCEVAFHRIFGGNDRKKVKLVASLNGTQVYSETNGDAGFQKRSFKIPRSRLRAGENALVFANEGDAHVAPEEGDDIPEYFSFDYVQLRIGRRSFGMCVIVR